MLSKTMATFLMLLALLAGLVGHKSESVTSAPPAPTEDAAAPPPPPPPQEGEMGGQFEPNGFGAGGY